MPTPVVKWKYTHKKWDQQRRIVDQYVYTCSSMEIYPQEIRSLLLHHKSLKVLLTSEVPAPASREPNYDGIQWHTWTETNYHSIH